MTSALRVNKFRYPAYDARIQSGTFIFINNNELAVAFDLSRVYEQIHRLILPHVTTKSAVKNGAARAVLIEDHAVRPVSRNTPHVLGEKQPTALSASIHVEDEVTTIAIFSDDGETVELAFDVDLLAQFHAALKKFFDL
jgi:hypothetical protein